MRHLWRCQQRWKDAILPTYEKNVLQYLRSFIRPLSISSLPKEAIFSSCRHILNHEFNLLGSGWVKVFPNMECMGIEGIRYATTASRGVNDQNARESSHIKQFISSTYHPIDWQIDFKSGYRWSEKIWSPDIQYGAQKGADVKVPWELARMQHLPMLAWGYAIESDPKYLIEFQNQILDFISANPPRYGVNWVCTMDVGIRVANWLVTYDLFRSYGAQFDRVFETIFTRSVFEHGKHIMGHLEWDPYLRSNHYLANIAGLLFVGAYLKHEKWLSFAIRELQAEIFSQFHPDGSNFEASTSYHRLSAEMVLYATALALELGVQFPQPYLDRIQKMADFTRDITKPDGTIVQFGDNDSGRFIKVFPDIDGGDHRYLVQAIRSMKDLTSVIQAQLEVKEERGRSFCSYEDFGLFIQRKGSWMLAIRCGSIGQKGNGGHAHNDQLSFELTLDGVSMIIDPGTYVYTPLPDARRWFRSSAMHNTLSVLGKEQAQDRGLFQMKDQAHAQVLRWDQRGFIGMHRGFDVVHQRTLRLHEECLEGVDECKIPIKQIVFHFAPGWEGKVLNARSTEWACASSQIVISSDQGTFRINSSEYSKAYGEKEPNSMLILEAQACCITWMICRLHRKA